jgi:hypothetical protein
MRFYKIQRDELEGFPTLFVVTESIGDRDEDGRITPYNEYADVGEDELRAMPGGPDALSRWRQRDDQLWYDKSELINAVATIEDDAHMAWLNALSPTARWDYLCERTFGHADPAKLTQEQLEWFGPRPPEHLQAV